MAATHSSPSFQIKHIQTLKDHKRGVSKVSFSPNAQILASSSADGMINLYSPTPASSSDASHSHYEQRAVLSGHDKGVSDFVWSSDSRYICSCSDNQLIIMWDVHTMKPVQLFPNPASLRVTPPHRIASGEVNETMNSALFLYDVFIENQIATTKSLRSNHTNANTITPRSNAASHNSHHNNKSNPMYTHTHTNTHSHANTRSNSHNNHNHHNSNSNSSNQAHKIMSTHNHYILCLALNTQGNILASGSFDETIILWDVRSAKHIKILSAHSEPVSCLSFCSDGTMLLSAGYDGLIRGWDMSSRRCIKTLGFDPTAVSFAKWSHNAQYIISGTLDSTLRIWDFQTAKTVKTLRGHVNKKYCLFSDFVKINNDLHCIVCGSEDGFIYFWDINTKQIVYKLQAHNDVVIAINFLNQNFQATDILTESLTFASGGLQNDNTVKIWQLDSI